MIARKSILFSASVCFIFLWCGCPKNKHIAELPCQLSVTGMEDYVSCYNIKQGSNWSYKLADSLRTGSIELSNSLASSIPNDPSPSKGSTQCDSFSRYSYTEINLKIKLNQSTQSNMFYAVGDDYVCFNRIKYRNVGTCVLALFYNASADTLHYTSEYSVQKNFQEKIWDSIQIAGKTYKNVHQMYYYPNYSGFKRVWWCPKVGFVKLEFVNPAKSQTEIWELQSSNVVL